MTEENYDSAVRNLQFYLRQISYDDPSISPPPVDGIYGTQTAQAVRQFQASNRLPVTGVADEKTWDAVYTAYRASVIDNSPPERVALFAGYENQASVRKGQNSFTVAAIQYMLTELARNDSAMPPVKVDGIFGNNTEIAVSDFQKKNRLPVNGAVDLHTWNRLTDLYNVLFETGKVE